MGIDPYGVESQLYESVQHLRNRTISRAGNIAARPIFDVRNSMIQTVYQISFVGADDSVRPSKSGDFPWSFVGADAHIGPLKCCGFASDLRKNGQFRRADRVVRPNGAKSKISTDSPENRHKIGAFGGSMRRPQASFEAQPRSARLLAPRWASTPTVWNRKYYLM